MSGEVILLAASRCRGILAAASCTVPQLTTRASSFATLASNLLDRKDQTVAVSPEAPASTPVHHALGYGDRSDGCSHHHRWLAAHRRLIAQHPLDGKGHSWRGFAAQASPSPVQPASVTGGGPEQEREGQKQQQAAAGADPSQAPPGESGTDGQQREAQQPGDEGAGAPPVRPPRDVYYAGPLSNQHKLLKRISITNTLVAFAAAPAIVTWADSVSLVSRYGLAASLVFFGMITTGALHWVAHPYVHELRYSAATGTIDVRTTTLLGSSRWSSFSVDDVQPLPWDRPVATFMAKDQFYYIDVYSFPDADLLRRLTPDEADVPQGYKDKDDDDD